MNTTFSSGNQLISRIYRTVTKKIVLKLYAMGGAGLGTSVTGHQELSPALDSELREHG